MCEVTLVGSRMGSRTPVFVNFQDPQQSPPNPGLEPVYVWEIEGQAFRADRQ